MRNTYKSRRKFFFIVPILIFFLITAIVMWLWNAILPDILGVHTLTYWQAMGILVLSKILFGGFGGFKKGDMRQRHKRNLINKFKNMSPEERIQFKEMWKQKYNQRSFCKHS